MESKLFVAIVLIFVVTLIADVAAADRKLREIRSDILNMKESINDLKFELGKLKIAVEKIGLNFEEVQRQVNVTSPARIAESGSTDNGDVQKLQERLNKQNEELKQIHSDLSNERNKRLELTVEVENNSKLLNSQNDLINTLESNINNINKTVASLAQTITKQKNLGNRKDTLQQLGNSLKAAFRVEKERLHNMSVSFINDTKRDQQLAKKDLVDFAENVNKSVEGFMDDVAELKSQTMEHEEKMRMVLKKIVDMNETIADVETKASQNELFLTDISACPNPTVEKGITDPPTSVSHGSVVTITCDQGYILIGKDTVTCNNGVFDDLPSCKPTACRNPTVENGYTDPPTSVVHGSAITITCGQGYILIGNHSATCNNGVFDHLPSCKPILFTDMRVVNRSSFNINLEDDWRTPTIYGSVFLPDDRLVLCDRRNKKLKLLSSTFTITDSLTLQTVPWDVAAVNSSTVIVTLPNPEQLQYVYVLPSLQPGSTIDLEKPCYGIVIMEEEIYLSCYKWGQSGGEVRVLSLDGRLKRRLGVDETNKFMFESPYYITVSQVTKNIYVSDFVSHQVTCLSSDGSILYEYTDPELQGPTGMFVDREDNIIVCGRDSNNLQVITADGKRHSTLLTSSDGISWPYTVSLRHSDTTLIVGSYDSNVLVFKLSP